MTLQRESRTNRRAYSEHAGSAPGASLIHDEPLRHPDTTNETAMTRRGWWLVVLNILMPGSAQILAGNKRLGRHGLRATLILWGVVVALVLTAVLSRRTVTWLFLGGGWISWLLLTIVQIGLIGYAILWVILTIDTLRLVRLVKTTVLSRLAIPIVAMLVLILSVAGALFVSNVAGSGRSALGTIFGNSGPSLPPSDGYYNVLLLGADSGDGRDSMRFDSISVISINADSGAVTITGIPRDLEDFPFADGPMNDQYPEGFWSHDDEECGWGGGVNQLTNAVEICREDGGTGLYPDASAQASTPAIEATKDAAAGILGIEVPYYVLIDMHGFADLIDALGGVEIDVAERLPEGGGPAYDGQPVDDWATGWIEPGLQRMDGETAQWYARSRYTTDDWDRMQRQRDLQEAILRQFAPANVISRFNEVASAGAHVVETDLPANKLPEFIDLFLDAKQQPMQRLELTPKNGVPQQWADWGYVHEMVDDLLHPPADESTE